MAILEQMYIIYRLFEGEKAFTSKSQHYSGLSARLLCLSFLGADSGGCAPLANPVVCPLDIPFISISSSFRCRRFWRERNVGRQSRSFRQPSSHSSASVLLKITSSCSRRIPFVSGTKLWETLVGQLRRWRLVEGDERRGRGGRGRGRRRKKGMGSPGGIGKGVKERSTYKKMRNQPIALQAA